MDTKNLLFNSLLIFINGSSLFLQTTDICPLRKSANEHNLFEVKNVDKQLSDLLELSKKNGFAGLTIPRSVILRPEEQFNQFWWNDYIFRFDKGDPYFLEIISSSQAELRKKDLCGEYTDEPGLQELKKSEDATTFRLLLISKKDHTCLGGAIVERQTRFQPYLTLLALYILPNNRSQGLANVLLQKISYLARVLHAEGVRLKPLPIGHVALTKEELAQWYEKKGFAYQEPPTKLSYMVNKSIDFKPNIEEKITILF
jgi:GNAT superfamily N-acetyltransferase